MRRREFLATAAGVLATPVATIARAAASAAERRFIYVAVPGIRNYVQYGGVGILIYDIDAGYKFVKRIPTWTMPAGQDPENVKGVAASAATGRIYVSTIRRLGCFDIATEKMLWEVTPEGGCDRQTISPDGRILYAPSFEQAHWNVIDAMTGRTITKIVLNSRAHNTLFSLDGTEVYLAGLASPMLSVADPRTHTVVRTVGPFAHSIRPFTVNGARTLAYVNVNELLGFEIGDLRTGQKLHRVEVQGYKMGPVARHGCPSHGVGLTPDEREVWVADGHNSAMHIFDNTVMPPKQVHTIKLRDQPGWITFSMDGRHAYPSTGEVFDVRTRERIAALDDEEGRQIGSEKLLEVIRDGQKIVRVGDQFGVGMRR
jgi:DNA-binding beta-propeller fold protein YncE